MIPKDCKRLAEVDFPIAVVSKHAAREKSIRHGHPSTLHLWWARRPLASSRAVLLALLWPDPCDPLCPSEFKEEAKKLLRTVGGCNPGKSDEDLRKALLRFIADFANWDLASNRTYVDVSRALVKAAHGEEPPLVVDPFAGGGSIPLEALRVGCEAFASDLNPVACLILKVMLEDIPRHGPKLAEELRRVGAEIKKQAEKEFANLYPKDPGGATPIAYLWSRTVRCESPNCGAEIPLVRSFWLSKKASRKRALRHRVERPKGEPPRVEFEVFEPNTDKDVPGGTVTRAKATCVCCGTVLPPERVRAQLVAQRGGADAVFDVKGRRTGGARMLAAVTLRPGEPGRHYRLPTERDYEAVRKALARAAKILVEWEHGGKQGLCPVPNESLPGRNTLGLRVPNYGVRSWANLFSQRQNYALASLIGLARADASKAEDLQRLIALAISRTADYCSANCSLHVGRDVVRNTWARNALPIVWDFYEINPVGGGSGDFGGAVDWIARVVEHASILTGNNGSAEQADAVESPLPSQASSIWFTDPPYYSAIGYAESSDFFYVWLKRALADSAFGNPFEPKSPVTPKAREVIQDDTFEAVYSIKKDAAFFESKMSEAFAEGRRVTRDDGVAAIVFAHKTTEGWEALIAAILKAGWTVTGSWPIQTEMENKVSGSQAGDKKAMLLASVHLICRPRPDDASIGDWADVLRELPTRVGDWMERLQGEGVRGADLVFACIGPALEIFSRYAKVETAEGREVPLAEYLEKVWEVVGRSALGQVLGTAEARARNGAAGAVEEDARLTALFLWTLQSTNGQAAENGGDESEDEQVGEDEEEDEGASRGKAKGFTLVFDVVRRFAQPLGIELPKWEGRVIEMKKGVVRLLPIAERAKQLFGEDGAQAVAARLEQEAALGPNPLQGMLFPEMEAVPRVRGRGARGRGKRATAEVSDESLAAAREATTLDRVHAAMLLQAGGRTNALRALLKSEQERGPDFLRLANALSALYPKGSEEKRLLDAMLLAVPR
jgi:adenine-specific DNA methylase